MTGYTTESDSLFQRNVSETQITARLRTISRSLGATGCMLSRASRRTLSKRVMWMRRSYVVLPDQHIVQLARGGEDALGQLAEAFHEPFRLSEQMHIAGAVLQEASLSMGVVITLPAGWYMFLRCLNLENESAIWDSRHALARIGAQITHALDQLRAASQNFEGVDADIVKLSRLQYPIKVIAATVNLSYNSVAKRREAICERFGMTTFDDVLMFLT